jgi:uncharacterized phiE125 gp8 family phage protein
MTSIRLNDPATEPVAVEEMRAHLRLNGSEEDSSLSGFLKAARTHIEQATRRALISQSWRLYLDGWPVGRIVRLPVSPVQSVDQITVYDRDGNASQLQPSDWQLDRSAQPERVKIKLGAGLPASDMMAAEIDFTAGYGAAASDVPENFRQAVRLLAGIGSNTGRPERIWLLPACRKGSTGCCRPSGCRSYEGRGLPCAGCPAAAFGDPVRFGGHNDHLRSCRIRVRRASPEKSERALCGQPDGKFQNLGDPLAALFRIGWRLADPLRYPRFPGFVGLRSNRPETGTSM